MEVILVKRVPNLGQVGEIIKVKDGYARNFLFPNQQAIKANKDNIAYYESRKNEIELDNLTKEKEAVSLKEKLDEMEIVLIRTSSTAGILYGSVNSKDIANLLIAQDIKVNKSQVVIEKPIKALGVEKVNIVLYADVVATILVNVARNNEEAETQMNKFKPPVEEPVENTETEGETATNESIDMKAEEKK